MPAKQTASVVTILVLFTLALAIGTDLFLFPAEQPGSGGAAILLNYIFNAGLWFLLLAAPVTVLFLFWNLMIDTKSMLRRKSQF